LVWELALTAAGHAQPCQQQQQQRQRQ
jgi:hypothetical protein